MRNIDYGPRTRTAEYTRVTQYFRQKLSSSGQVIWTDQGEYELDIWEEYMTDVVTERFKERRAAGEIINNPVLKRKTVYSGNLATSSVRVGSYSYPGTHPLIEFPPDSAVPVDNFEAARERAATQAYAKVSSSEASVLVTIGELSETRALLVSIVKRLHSVLRLIALAKMIDLKDVAHGARTAIRSVPDLWMEYRYAWKPLIKDIETLSKATEKLASDFSKRQTFRSSVALTNVVQRREVRSVDGGNFHYAFYHYASVSGNAFSGVLCEQRYAGFPDTYGLWKFGSAAFDLTRLSFALGWFFNVATVIAAWEPDTLWTPLTNWVTLRYKHSQLITIGEQVYNNPTHSGGWTGWMRKQESIVWQRFPLQPRQVIPQFVPKITWDRCTDLIIIVSQLWKNLRPKNIAKLYGKR